MLVETPGVSIKRNVGSSSATGKTRTIAMQDLLDEIADLKAKNNATILAHYYQEGEIQDIADYAGDSLNLARAATKVQTSTIVFCGVHFMAETAKILNPEKRVLLPDLLAGCSLADSCPADKLARYQEMLRINGRRFQTVTYINSTAAVKALSDWVVTSGNAEDDHPPRPRRSGDSLRAGSSPRPVSARNHRSQDDPLGRRLHGPRNLQRRRFVGAETEDARRGYAGPSRVSRQYPRTQRIRRRHRGDGQARRPASRRRLISLLPRKRT